jgi:hypothetical protein
VPHISIAYTAPVQVIVDLDTKQVTRVVVIDEDLTPDRNGYRENHHTGRTLHPPAGRRRLRRRRDQPMAQLGHHVVTAVSDLRILHVEIQTEHADAEHHVRSLLDHLVHTDATGTAAGYRSLITEDRQPLLRAEGAAADPPDASPSSARRGAS